MLPQEPATKRAVAFFDGQNLFYAAKKAFGYNFPNYDPSALAQAVCVRQGWQLSQVRFYTGIPSVQADPQRHAFWTEKLRHMNSAGVVTFTRRLQYRNKVIALPDGSAHTLLVGQEKGIDVRIALDIIGVAYRNQADVILVFSQDQDLSEAADEIRQIAADQKRWIKIASAFPLSPTVFNPRGINNTDWIRLDRALYETCIDPRDYRPKGG